MNSTMKFEEALAKLEEAVRLLEGGKLTLDESIEKYEDTLKYVRICNEMLEKAEQKVKILLEDGNGGMAESDFGKAEGRS